MDASFFVAPNYRLHFLVDLLANRADRNSLHFLINRTQHVNLVDALLQLEYILAGIERNLEIENSHQFYLDMLDAMAFHIATYEDLFTNIKGALCR